MSEFSRDKPTENGHYWVWQPKKQWPCHGRVLPVFVEASALGVTAGVPFMDYADGINTETWNNALWLKADVPDAPKEST